MHMRMLVAAAMATALLTGCSSPLDLFPKSPFTDHSEDLPDRAIAILDWSGWDDVFVLGVDDNEISLGPTEARLMPGTHTVSYGRCGPKDSAIMGYTRHCRWETATVALQAGRIYVVEGEGSGKGTRIRDVATGAILARADIEPPT
jgi:hypothetical protein